MIFIMGLIALGVTALLAWPLLRKPAPHLAAATSPHVAEYQRRLSDLERDVSRGLIGAQEAEIARAEIGRQLLAEQKELKAVAPAASDTGASLGATKLQRLAVIAMVLLIPVATFLIYFQLGNPGLRDQPLHIRQNQPAEEQRTSGQAAGTQVDNAQIEDLIAQLEARLAANPEEAEGWEILARTYESLKRESDAARAWKGLLAVRPDHADALWFSGVHAAQGGRPEEARAHWLKLQSQFSPETDDYKLLDQALGTLDQ